MDTETIFSFLTAAAESSREAGEALSALGRALENHEESRGCFEEAEREAEHLRTELEADRKALEKARADAMSFLAVDFRARGRQVTSGGGGLVAVFKPKSVVAVSPHTCSQMIVNGGDLVAYDSKTDQVCYVGPMTTGPSGRPRGRVYLVRD